MTASLIVSALCLLLVGTLVGVRAVRAARERHWLGGTIRGLVALLLLATLAALTRRRVDRASVTTTPGYVLAIGLVLLVFVPSC